jgi:hypothetical protein
MKDKLWGYVTCKSDFDKVEKLLTLTNLDTFWNDVRTFTSGVQSDRSLRRWQILSEARYKHLAEEKNICLTKS